MYIQGILGFLRGITCTKVKSTRKNKSPSLLFSDLFCCSDLFLDPDLSSRLISVQKGRSYQKKNKTIFRCKRQQVKTSSSCTSYLLLVQLDFDLQYLCGQFQQFSMCLDLNRVPIYDKEKGNKANCQAKLLHLHT